MKLKNSTPLSDDLLVLQSFSFIPFQQSANCRNVESGILI